MEYVAGAEPRAAARRGRGRSTSGDWRPGLLRRLRRIHERGIVHRDVKPHNVLLAEGGEAEARRLRYRPPPRSRRRSPRPDRSWAPPATWRRRLLEGETAGPASDLYSCGVVLSESVAKSGSAPPRVARLAGRLAAADPADRPASAAAALADLEGRAPGRPRPRPDGPRRRRRSPRRRPRLASAPRDRARMPSDVPTARRLVAIAGLAAPRADRPLVIVTSGGGDDSDARGVAGEGPRRGGPSRRRAPREGNHEGETPGPAGPGRGRRHGRRLATTPTQADIRQAAALNDEGFALTQSGDYDRAVSVLRRAVDAFPEGTERPQIRLRPLQPRPRAAAGRATPRPRSRCPRGAACRSPTRPTSCAASSTPPAPRPTRPGPRVQAGSGSSSPGHSPVRRSKPLRGRSGRRLRAARGRSRPEGAIADRQLPARHVAVLRLGRLLVVDQPPDAASKIFLPTNPASRPPRMLDGDEEELAHRVSRPAARGPRGRSCAPRGPRPRARASARARRSSRRRTAARGSRSTARPGRR